MGRADIDGARVQKRNTQELPEPTVLLTFDTRHDGPGLKVSQWSGTRLRRLLRGRVITPVLGPDCVSAVPGGAAVIPDDGLLLARLTQGPPELLAFFEAITAQRICGRQVVEVPPSAGGTTEDRALAEVRLALLKCAYEATRGYVHSWNPATSPVHDWQSHDVEILDSVALAQAISEARHALECVAELPAGSAIAKLLRPDSLQLRLEGLGEHLWGGGAVTEGAIRLEGTVVEWLTDIFWLAYTCVAPVYPRADELALQVSIIGSSDSVPFRRMEPSAAVHREEVEEFLGAIHRSVERGFVAQRVDVVRAGFHGGVAASLHHAFERWDQSHRKARGTPPAAIAITSSFDLELERALALSPGAGRFHVAFPVFVTVRRGDVLGPRGRLRWIAGTFVAKSDGEGMDRQAWLDYLRDPLDGEWMWLDDLAKGNFPTKLEGPLVLKVNGSPLHRLEADLQSHARLVRNDDDQAMFGGSQKVEDNGDPVLFHAAVVAEFDVMQVTHIDEWASGTRINEGAGIDPQGLPMGILSALASTDRYWLLLGQRMSDWNTRLQLFLHLQRGRVDETDQRAMAVNPSWDGDRGRLLTSMAVQLMTGELDELGALLHEMAAYNGGA